MTQMSLNRRRADNVITQAQADYLTAHIHDRIKSIGPESYERISHKRQYVPLSMIKLLIDECVGHNENPS